MLTVHMVALKMLTYTFDIKYTSGKKHAHVGSLSRNPVDKGMKQNEDKALKLPVLSLPGLAVAKAQRADSTLLPIMQEVEKPSQQDTKLGRLSKKFGLKNGIMYKINTRPEGREKLLVIISGDITGMDFLKMLRTMSKLVLIDRPKKGTNMKPVGLLQPVPSDEPFDRVNSNLLGPSPKTKRGNKYAIPCIAYGTRWAETRAVPAGIAQEVVQHSTTESILSDRGQMFSSAVVKKLLKLMDVQGTMTSGYRAECNGVVKGLHATITTMTNQKDWDLSLPLITFAYNISRQESTTFLLVYGREPVLPSDICLNQRVNEAESKRLQRKWSGRLSRSRRWRKLVSNN
ncbi:hypothetical protein PR048_013125 [Dryococelus australis]|uniref:Integrase catalytic domain-containing protein n=1 Tax=Dryococelus australis TaxID=614101 RepID=A0ABQ9HS53_9NEOP|nr:hypothetical protein PR048_013125 [Dryococelus australis]